MEHKGVRPSSTTPETMNSPPHDESLCCKFANRIAKPCANLLICYLINPLIGLLNKLCFNIKKLDTFTIHRNETIPSTLTTPESGRHNKKETIYYCSDSWKFYSNLDDYLDSGTDKVNDEDIEVKPEHEKRRELWHKMAFLKKKNRFVMEEVKKVNPESKLGQNCNKELSDKERELVRKTMPVLRNIFKLAAEIINEIKKESPSLLLSKERMIYVNYFIDKSVTYPSVRRDESAFIPERIKYISQNVDKKIGFIENELMQICL